MAISVSESRNLSVNITYQRATNNQTALKIWIDYNNDGDFLDAGEEVYSNLAAVSTATSITATLSNILVPETATLGKTRMRIGMRQGDLNFIACDFGFATGEIEDYDVTIIPPDNTAYESAMITQVYQSGTDERWIEITNTNASVTIPGNKVYVSLFKDKSGDQTGVAPDATYTIASPILPGESLLINSSTAAFSNVLGTATLVTNNSLTDFAGANDIIVVSKKTGTDVWQYRFDVVSNISNNTSYVRKDNVTTYNNTYTASNWVAFPSAATIENGPVLSDISATGTGTNMQLGYHKINGTTYTTSWSNGNPDRTRTVDISGALAQSTQFNARDLNLTGTGSLTVTDNLLLIDNSITIGVTAALKLAGTAQLIQTHTGATANSGSGKLYVDQESEVSSIYRFNYMSSPVSTTGLNTYNLLNVFKDGTIPTSAGSTSSTPKAINFISGYDGNYSASPSGPIALASYWIYTYDDTGNGSYNYIQKGITDLINPGKGFMFKSPGRIQNYTFTGTPNDGNYTYNSIPANTSVLVGNPYPSAFSASRFIADNLSATNGTLYLWQQAGENDASGVAGHASRGYVGGYATVNQVTSTAAVGITESTYNLEAIKATLGGDATQSGAAIEMNKINASIRFKFTGLSVSVDSLFVIYKSSQDKNISFFVNNESTSTDITVPNTSGLLDTLAVKLSIKKNDSILLVSTDNNPFTISRVYVKQKFSYTAPPTHVAVAQGFFITTGVSGGNLVFKNSQREYVPKGTQGSLFFKSAKTNATSSSQVALPILKLGMDYVSSDNLNFHRQIAISFKSGNTFGYEIGYDSELFDKGTTDMYWKFPGDSKTYVIAGIQELSTSLEVPIEIVINDKQKVKIKIDDFENINQDIYIKDKTTNTFYSISAGPVELSLDPGTYTDRFVITFAYKALDIEDVILNTTSLYYDYNTRQIIINNSLGTNIEKIVLYNILGQPIKTWEHLGNNSINRLNIKALPISVYIVKVKTSEGNFSKKIIIH